MLSTGFSILHLPAILRLLSIFTNNKIEYCVSLLLQNNYKSDMAELLRKFYKITGLHNVFELTNGQYYSTNSFIDTFQSAYNQKINEHTVLFITCDEQDEDKYVYTYSNEQSTELYKLKAGTTIIWARNSCYAISTTGVRNVDYDAKKNAFIIEYDNGSVKELKTPSLVYTGGTNIEISNNSISALGYFYDSDQENFIEGVNNPDTSVDARNSHVEGIDNYANGIAQHISGMYAVPNENDLFVVGNGDDVKRSNAFSVDSSGIANALLDVIAGENNKLSDLHNITDDDWYIK